VQVFLLQVTTGRAGTGLVKRSTSKEYTMDIW